MGVLFFSSSGEQSCISNTIDFVKHAESSKLDFVSFPERHFDRFGGCFPNPLLYMAMASSITKNIELRSGSIIPALHNLTRLKEDIRMVDIMSEGRIGLSFGSGWNPNDFALNPDAFTERKIWLRDFIQNFDKWYEESKVTLKNGVGVDRDIMVYPKPFSKKIPLWLTISENKDAWYFAGKAGYNVLTHMENVNHDDLELRVKEYRRGQIESERSNDSGVITLMQHTLILQGKHEESVARRWLSEYIIDALLLEKKSVQDTSSMSGNKQIEMEHLTDEMLLDIADRATRKYVDANSLVCSRDEAIHRIQILEKIGINEIACMFDFANSKELIKRSISEISYIKSVANQNHKNILIKEFSE